MFSFFFSLFFGQPSLKTLELFFSLTCLLSAAFQPKGVLMKRSVSVLLDPDMTSKFTIPVASTDLYLITLSLNLPTISFSDGQQQIVINSNIPVKDMLLNTRASTTIYLTGENKDCTNVKDYIKSFMEGGCCKP